jgi:hypothetical protein
MAQIAAPRALGQGLPASTGRPDFSQPWIPSGITNTFAYPSWAASRAAAWLAVQRGFEQ